MAQFLIRTVEHLNEQAEKIPEISAVRLRVKF